VTSGPEWTAIILAGQRPGEAGFAAAHGVATKALIPVGGTPMLGRVARAVLDAPSVGRVLVLAQEPEALLAGPLEWLAADGRIGTARAGDGISNSILAVAGGESAPWPVLVTTADHVLLTPAILESFIAGIGPADDVGFAVVERRTVEADYPDTRRTWIRFSDGDYTGANLFALRGPASRDAVGAWSRVERDRKKVVRLLMHFGPLLALRAVTRTISLDKALASVARRLGVRAAVVRLSQAEAAIDVDKPEDLDLAEAIVGGFPRRAAGGR
jgi:GTP:adenosylcobinamide-phosphate guanylyltransferase